MISRHYGRYLRDYGRLDVTPDRHAARMTPTSRFDANGQLWVRDQDGWMTHQRYIAASYLRRYGCPLTYGSDLPQGHRIDLANSASPVAIHNLTVKPLGKPRIPLIEFAKRTRSAPAA